MDPTIKEFSEKIKRLLSNPQVIDQIYAEMNSQNLPLHTPCLKLEVIGNEEAYELEIEDVRSVFNVFGEVLQVSVIPYGMALVMYKEIISAYIAQKILNDNHPVNQNQSELMKQTQDKGKDEEETKEDKIEEEEIELIPTLTLDPSKQNTTKTQERQRHQQQPKKQNQSANQNVQNQNSSSQSKSLSNSAVYQNQKQEYQIKNSLNQNSSEESGTSSRPSAKFTCRYEIQISNDKDFQVARRIIGPRGSNMKKVVDMCVRDMPVHYQAQDVIKLRLRGKGSGFKEGPNQQESNEPLHLCVSSKYNDKYILACEQCEQLIKQVYEDYKVYCKQKGLEVPNLQLKKQQNPNQQGQQQNAFLKSFEIGSNPNDQEIQAWIEARNEARRRCDFEEADRIRDMLKQKNIVLIDEKGARGKCITTWKVESR